MTSTWPPVASSGSPASTESTNGSNGHGAFSLPGPHRLARFHGLIDEVRDLHDKKNHDYAQDTDPLSNFRMAASLGVEPWRGCLVRASDKWSRIQQLAQGKTPKNESLRDSLVDLAVYSLIAVLLLEDAQNGA